MGKKMSITSFFKPKDHNTKPAWPWPSCKQPPKTLSFRAGKDMQKVVNSACLHPTSDEVHSPISCFTNSSECPSFSTDQSEESTAAGNVAEAVLRGLQSDRLFFEPKGVGKCMVEEETCEVVEDRPYKESVVMAVESDDPYIDFKTSMEEMVEAHGLKEWDCLEELLLWYLKMNETTMQRYIVAAFVDLLVEIVASNLDKSSEDSVSECSLDHQGKNNFLER